MPDGPRCRPMPARIPPAWIGRLRHALALAVLRAGIRSGPRPARPAYRSHRPCPRPGPRRLLGPERRRRAAPGPCLDGAAAPARARREAWLLSPLPFFLPVRSMARPRPPTARSWSMRDIPRLRGKPAAGRVSPPGGARAVGAGVGDPPGGPHAVGLGAEREIAGRGPARANRRSAPSGSMPPRPTPASALRSGASLRLRSAAARPAGRWPRSQRSQPGRLLRLRARLGAGRAGPGPRPGVPGGRRGCRSAARRSRALRAPRRPRRAPGRHPPHQPRPSPRAGARGRQRAPRQGRTMGHARLGLPLQKPVGQGRRCRPAPCCHHAPTPRPSCHERAAP